MIFFFCVDMLPSDYKCDTQRIWAYFMTHTRVSFVYRCLYIDVHICMSLCLLLHHYIVIKSGLTFYIFGSITRSFIDQQSIKYTPVFKQCLHSKWCDSISRGHSLKLMCEELCSAKDDYIFFLCHRGLSNVFFLYCLRTCKMQKEMYVELREIISNLKTIVGILREILQIFRINFCSKCLQGNSIITKKH